MTTNTTTTSWIRRVAAGAVLAAVPALIALGTATASHAAETNSTSPSSSPTPVQTAPHQGAEDGSVALPPGGPLEIYPQGQSTGGANPYTPFGTNPYVPHGVWTP